MNPIITTDRLDLVAGTAPTARADINNRADFSRLLVARVPPDWPPVLHDAVSREDAARFLEENPQAVGWGIWYFVLRAGGTLGRIVIGIGRFKGEPASDGTVEIGYSILPDYQNLGFATEVVGGFLSWAFAHPKVQRVAAETLPELIASRRVMEKNGLTFVGQGSEEGVLRFEISRTAYRRQINPSQ